MDSRALHGYFILEGSRIVSPVTMDGPAAEKLQGARVFHIPVGPGLQHLEGGHVVLGCEGSVDQLAFQVGMALADKRLTDEGRSGQQNDRPRFERAAGLQRREGAFGGLQPFSGVTGQDRLRHTAGAGQETGDGC